MSGQRENFLAQNLFTAVPGLHIMRIQLQQGIKILHGTIESALLCPNAGAGMECFNQSRVHVECLVEIRDGPVEIPFLAESKTPTPECLCFARVDAQRGAVVINSLEQISLFFEIEATPDKNLREPWGVMFEGKFNAA